MNNSTRNLKMKKLLIATTALVATAGMASADITISGHAAAGIYSGLSNKDGTAKVKAKDAVTATTIAKATVEAYNTTVSVDIDTPVLVDDETKMRALLLELNADRAAAVKAYNGLSAPTGTEVDAHAAELKAYDAMIALATGTAGVTAAAASVGTYSADGVYSNAGVDFTMSGATDNGISFSATVNIDAVLKLTQATSN